MALTAATGRSKNPITETAALEAVQMALTKLQGQQPDLAIVFSSVYHDQQKLVTSITQALPPTTKIVGCSDAGEITEDGPDTKTISIMLLSAPGLSIYTAVGGDIAQNARAAGQEIAEKIKQQAGGVPKIFFMLPDGLAGNGTEIVAGIQAVFGEHYRFVGGSAGDDFLFKKTYQYHGNQVYSGQIVGVGINGDVHFGIGVRHGWKMLGTPRKVTKAHDNIIEEIDGKPAISIYEDYFGKEKADVLHKEPLARLAITYPLGMRVPGGTDWLIRDPISVDEKGVITCAAAIPEGSDVYLMIGGKEEAIAASREAAKQAVTELGQHTPKAILNFNCIARNRLFGLHSGDEIKAMLETVNSQQAVPFLGFYTYGEQAPMGDDMATCQPSFHNETSVLLILGE